MSHQIQVLTETFFVANESCVFTFDGCTLQWRDNSVPVRNILIVDYVHEGNCCKNHLFIFRKGAHKCKGHDTVVIRYAQCQKKNRLRLCDLKIQGEYMQLCKWLVVLREALEKVAQKRPKRYLVFVNPFSGRQNGVDLYTKKVKPILDAARIETCVIVTKNEGDFEKVICSGIDCYDAILAVGGDGTVSEIVNCLISSQMDTMYPCTEDEVVVPTIKIPIAIVPCGSTDCIAFTLNGTRDTETCVLYAIFGEFQRYDVCRAVSETGCTKFFLSVFTYGFLSDLIRESEKFRWMGPIRYNYAGLLTLIRSKEYYGQLDLIGEECRKKCMRKSGLTNKRSSMCMMPFVPTVEPAPECMQPAPRKRVRPIIPVTEEKKKPCTCEAESDEDEVCIEELPKKEEKFETKYRREPEARNAEIPCGASKEEPKKDEHGTGDGMEEYEFLSVHGFDPVLIEEREVTLCMNELQAPLGDGLPRQRSCHDVVLQSQVRDVVPLVSDVVKCKFKGEEICIKGRYFLIACANISCSSEITPNGIAPECVPGDGHMNVVLFQPNTICDLYKIYSRLTSKDKDVLMSDLPFVSIYKTKRVQINVLQKGGVKNIANLDGELFVGSIVDIRIIEGVIRFFARVPHSKNCCS